MEAFRKFPKPEAGCAAHSLVEVYASLTRMPGEHRMSAAQAMLFLSTVQERLTVVALDASEYFAGLERFAALSIAGGTIYDAMLALCALKANAETVYTWNLRHFRLCGPEIASRLATP
jgi:predicted nucleic acid-binding protein